MDTHFDQEIGVAGSVRHCFKLSLALGPMSFLGSLGLVRRGPLADLSAASQALAESFCALQERNLKYAQSVVESTFAFLKKHVANAHSLLEYWEKEMQKQQALEMIETSSKQSLESFQKVMDSEGGKRWIYS